MAFNPPGGVANGATYGYGNMVWEFESVKGVWNIAGGSLIGSIGPTGATGVGGAGAVPLAKNSLTGVASFKPNDFAVSVTGNVSLTGDIARLSYSNTFTEAKNEFTQAVGIRSIDTETISPWGYGAGDGYGYIGLTSAVGGQININSIKVMLGLDPSEGYSPSSIKLGNDKSNPVISMASATGNNLGKMELYPSGLVFGGPAYTTPLMITGGVFRNPSEFAPHFTLAEGTNQLIINGLSGSIQRFTINPSQRVTVTMGSGWHSLTAATETIAVIIQNISSPSLTGVFDSNILTEGSPIMFGQDTATSVGVPGGISILTLMRVNKGGGNTLNMGFVIATGMTAAGFNIN